MKSRPNPFLLIPAVLAAAATSAHAADYTWAGGVGNWSDANWNPGPVSGPTSGSDTATINSGSVSLNVGGMNIASLTLGAGGTFNAYNWNGTNTYTAYNNLVLQGGTVDGIGSYQNWGAGILKNVTASGSSASTLSSSSLFNLNGTDGSSSVFEVGDVTGDANADLTVSARLADVSNGWGWFAAALVKNGVGTMRLTAINDYTGGTTVNAGTLLLDGGSGGNARIRGALTVNSGATVNFANDDGTGLGWNGSAKVTALTISGGTVSSGGIMHVWNLGGGVTMTAGTLQSNNGVSDPNGPQLEWNSTSVTTNASADTATIGGRIRMRADGGYSGISFNVADGTAATDLLVNAAITEASGGLGITKSGAGTMKLTGYNTYSGSTTVNDGTLELNGASGGNGIIRGTVTVNAGATLAVTGGDGTGFGWNNPISSLSINGGTVAATGGSHLGFGSHANVVLSNGGSIAGNWQWNGDSLLGFNSSGDSTNTISGSLTLRPDAGTNHTFTVADGAADVDLQINANLSDQYPEVWWLPASGLTKAGAGSMVLAGTNSYNGNTTVSNGKLVVNGDISTSSLTIVESGATLAGIGTVGSASLNGTLAPGNSIGTLGISGDLTLNGSAISNFEIDPTLGLADLANATGTVTFGGILNVLYGGNPADFTNGMVFDLFNGASFAGGFSEINLPTLGGGLTWQDNLLDNGSLTVIPEPGTALLGGIAMLMLLHRKRR